MINLGRTLSGKTSFLKTIAGLQPVDEGEITLDEKDFRSIPVWERNVAMVYQQFINYPHLNVYENIAFPLKQRKMSAADARLDEVLGDVGLGHLDQRYPSELSGGQQQRVALARLLATQPPIFLMDEPLSNLDARLRMDMRVELKRFQSEAKESILIYASTDPQEAMQLNGDIVVIDEGRVLQTGPAKEVFENPLNIKVAEITNDPAMNILPGIIDDKEIIFNEDFKLNLPSHLSHLDSGKYFFGVRATDLNLDDSGFSFTVDISEISGSETFLHIHQDELKVVLMIEEVRNFNLDDQGKKILARIQNYL